MAVENERFYKPGVYFNHTEMSTDGIYTTVVVVVDAYGQIIGVSFDDTMTESKFKIDAEDNLYVYVPGDKVSVPNTYRLLADQTSLVYPTFADAITAQDLVEGVHNAAIAALTDVESFETSRVLGAAWVAEADLLGEAIMADQTTYGIQTMTSGSNVTATNVADVTLTNVDVLLGLVQEILDGEAMLMEDTVLATEAVMGLYTPGMYYGATDRVIGSSITYYTSFVAVDANGRIAGVFADATVGGAAEGEKATKWILGEEGYPMPGGWHNQAIAYGEAIVMNQGLDGFTTTTTKGETTYTNGRYYVEGLAGVTIHVEDVDVAINEALAQATEWEFEAGTYYIAAGETFMFATVDGSGLIQNIVIDQVRAEESVTYMVDGEEFMLYTYEQQKVVAEELVERTLLVYKDGEDYRSVYDVLEDGYAEGLDAEDAVTFELDAELGIDEMATLEVVAGNFTKQVLGAKYAEGVFTSPWNVQAETFAAEFLGGDSPYVINLTDGTHTDVTGVTIKVNKYQQMLVDLLIDAQDDANAYMAFATESAPTDELANGMYFVSLTPNTDGEQAVAYMTVKDNTIVELAFDVTTVDGGVLTTYNMLGDAETPLAEGVTVEPTNDDFYELAPLAAQWIMDNQDDIVAEIETGYDYKEDGDFTAATATEWTSYDGTDYQSLTELLVQEALFARVQEIADAAGAAFMADLTLAAGEIAAARVLDVEIANLISFGVSYDPVNDEIIDISSAGVYEAQEVSANTEGQVILTLDYDGIDYIYTADVAVNSVSSLNNAILADLHKTDLDGLNILSGVSSALDTDNGFQINNAGARVVVPVVWWQDYDGETPTSGIANLDELGAGTHVLTAAIEYEEDLFVTRDYTVVVVSEEDALEAAMASLLPGIILDNGEFTAAMADLPTETSVEGVTIAWVEDSTQATYAAGELDLTRMYTSEKVTLTATVTAGGSSDTESFEFRIVPLTAAAVKARMQADVADVFDATVMYVDLGATGVIDNTSGLFSTAIFADENLAGVTLTFSLDSEDDAHSGLLGIDAATGEVEVLLDTYAGAPFEVTVIATITNDTDATVAGDEVEFAIDYKFTAFAN
jgi:hypothetical protein